MSDGAYLNGAEVTYYTSDSADDEKVNREVKELLLEVTQKYIDEHPSDFVSKEPM